MNCDKFRENISYYIDDILDDNDKREFEDHMKSCEQCRCEYEQMLILIDSLNSVEQVPLPDNYDETLRKKLNNEKVKAKKKWSKYMYIAASLAIVLFSSQNIDKLKTLDVQENPNIEVSEYSNQEDVQQNTIQNNDKVNTEGDNSTEEMKRVAAVSDKTNISVPDKKEVASTYNMKPINDDEPSVDEPSVQNIETVQKEQDDNNIMNIQMSSDEPLKQKTRSINQFNSLNEHQKNVKVGDNFDIILENPKGTSYSMVCNDEDSLIEFMSQSVSENEEVYSYTWKFKAIKEGKIKISYILHDKTDKNKVYNKVVYEINIQK
ncbi:zf-HC2 domain-containing protein [Tepidibacter hydrothermalis]|uniref:Anti-sigma-W factor RsiW n=1 Tax=Tepidibacter hydrothermalis TaxID=3036126 RepID=A0ABY8E8T2_9FIRM|nr:zf-HC2 domain-containing protein [Tepidibacter hydrothermalis]WFD09279.1 zf-HC2 domain-containing protein [Tepidibacter hydrothermalis]